MKLCVQSDNDILPLARRFKNSGVSGGRHSKVADMHSRNAICRQVCYGRPRQALVEQQHHIVGSSTTRSSRLAAAYSSA